MEEAMKLKVLVADDEKDICKAIRFLLEQEDYSVTCVYSGEEAVDAIHKDHFDAILTDLKMRGIDGMALLEKARELSPTTPVIIMTAFVSHESALEATRCGAADYIVKPFLNEDVKLTLRKIIDRNRMLLDMMKNDIGVG
jgi:DNA-binding NtrC family response regulator